MQAIIPAWYSVRTKPKHEHIASANLQRQLNLPVFFPRLRLEKMTRRGVVRVVEPLFPCYLFVRCPIEELDVEIQYVSGVSYLVKFGHRYPPVGDAVIEDLQACFGASDFIAVENRLTPGEEVTVASGAFEGMSAQVLKDLPAKRRVQLLLDILGRPTTVEVGRETVMPVHHALTDLAPFLAASGVPEMARA